MSNARQPLGKSTCSYREWLALDGVADCRRLEEHAEREVADDLAVVVHGLKKYLSVFRLLKPGAI